MKSNWLILCIAAIGMVGCGSYRANREYRRERDKFSLSQQIQSDCAKYGSLWAEGWMPANAASCHGKGMKFDPLGGEVRDKDGHHKDYWGSCYSDCSQFSKEELDNPPNIPDPPKGYSE